MREEWNWVYGWWEKRKRHLMPGYYKDPRNYLLNESELAAYLQVLTDMVKVIDAEKNRVFATRRALSTGHVMSYEPDPQPITLAHVLQFQLNIAKQKHAFLRLLLEWSGKRVNNKRVELELARWEGEGGSHVVR